MSKKALLVHRDGQEYRELRRQLEEGGLSVAEAGTGIQALALAEIDNPGLVIVQHPLPDMSGLELCRRIQSICSTPTLLLGAPDDETMRACQNAGPTDQVNSPYSGEEIAARARQLLKVASDTTDDALRAGRILEVGDVTLDLQTNQVTVAGRGLALPPTQVNLLRVLVERAPRVTSPEALTEKLWPRGYQDHSVLADVVMNLRIAVEDDPANPTRIVYVADYGYKLVPVTPERAPRTLSRN
jgi:DNA-binding response OmpR family regulator